MSQETSSAANVADGATYDVFLSHNGDDKQAVTELAERLRDRASLKPFLDSWHLVPGEPWQEALEAAIDASRTCAVFVGPAGLGTWENEEMRAALSRRAHNEDFRVIPVMLPGAVLPSKGRLPAFLARLTWVDFRPGLDDEAAFDRLVSGIQGLAPEDGETADEEDTPIVCPFRGLEVFDEEHAEYFFGREALTQYLVEQLRDDRFLAVVGASGSGKSSVVRAGLVPHLRAGELPGSKDWQVAIVKPGPHPLEAIASRIAAVLMPGDGVLAARDAVLGKLQENERGLHVVVQTALGDAGADGRVLIVVDQFEEIFTLCHDDAERSAFVDVLIYASSVVGGQAVVVTTMRADFFGKCATLPVLAARLADRDVLVPPMDEDELRRAMILPAERAGLQFEKGLVDTILDDLDGEPGSLPLLEHTLFELFEERRGRWLTIDRYHDIGGVRGAIAQRAEAVYARLTPEQQAAARRIMLRLTEPGEGTEDTRRRAPVSELLPTGAPPDAVEAVVNQLAEARLLVMSETETGDDVVDVAHEALIRGWPRLQAWIAENPAAMRVHRRLTETAAEWSTAGRDPSYLFGGQRLDEALRWSADNDDDLNELERDFLVAAEAARSKEADARRRRTRLAIAGAAVAFLAVAVAGAFAAVKWQDAELSARLTNAQLLLANGKQDAIEDPLRGVTIVFDGLGEAHGASYGPDQFLTDIEDLLRSGRYAFLGPDVEHVFPSPDGRYLVVDAIGLPDSLVWAANGGTVALLAGEVEGVQFPGGTDAGVFSVTLAGASGVLGPGELHRLSDGAVVPLTGIGFVQIDVSPDPRSRIVVVTYGKPPEPPELIPPETSDPDPDTSDPDPDASDPDEAVALASAQPGVGLPTGPISAPRKSPAELRSAQDGRLIRTLSRPADGSWFIDGPAGPVVAVSYSDGTPAVELFQASDGTPIRVFASTDEIEVFDAGNQTIVTRSSEGCAIWDAAVQAPLNEVPGCRFFEASPDRSAIAFLTEGGGVIRRPADRGARTELPAGVSDVTFSPDVGASRMVVSGAGLPSQLLETDGAGVVLTLDGPIAPFDPESDDPGLAFSADGRYLFASTTGKGGVYDAVTGQPVRLEIPGGTLPAASQVTFAQFSSDERGPVYVGFADGRRALFRLPQRDVIQVYQGFNDVHFWPGDGPMLVDGQLQDVGPGILAELRNGSSGDLLDKLAGAKIDSVRFSSRFDAHAAVVTYSTGYTPQHFALPEIVGEDGSHVSLSAPVVNFSDLNADSAIQFSPDASAFVVRYQDGHMEVWDRRGAPRMLIDLGLGVTTYWVDPKGDRLATSDRTGSGYLLDMELLRSLPARGEPLSEEVLIERFCGLLRRAGHEERLPVWLAGRC